jgi:hypothetical protein
MYELLLQWGLESLAKLVAVKGEKDSAILLEAVRAKNSLVVERFRYAREACQAIVDLAIQVDTDLEEFRLKAPETDGTLPATKKFMGELKLDFHPKYYRRLKKLRSQFESTNDVLSAYSVVMSDLLHFSTMEKIAIEKKLRSSSDLCRTYRGLWTLYAEILTSLVRLTSNDLRFWLIDAPYIVQAERWAKQDFELAMTFLLAKEWGGMSFRISLETKEGLESFWKSIQSGSK